MARIGYVYDPIYLRHGLPSHPERPERLEAIINYLQAEGLLERLTEVQARDATIEELGLVHEPALVQEVRSAAASSAWFDSDTYTQATSYYAALRAVGGCLAALEAILDGNIESAFCLVRPPGHHATPSRAMGFCLFNNVAVAAAYANHRCGLERVAIVDFDVHHGNGTQDAFYGDPNVFYFSTHQYPFYPGSGHYSENGEHEGVGRTVNVPLPAGIGSDQFIGIYRDICVPLIKRYRPQLILVSAGFDAHFDDPLAHLQVSSRGYYEVTSLLQELASELCEGRLLFALEGGYDLTALSSSVRSCLDALLSGPYVPDELAEPENQPVTVDPVVSAVRRIHGLEAERAI